MSVGTIARYDYFTESYVLISLLLYSGCITLAGGSHTKPQTHQPTEKKGKQIGCSPKLTQMQIPRTKRIQQYIQ